MTFKQHWEKTEQRYDISAQTIEGMVALAFPEVKLTLHEIISGGCANLNIKIFLERQEQPSILRVYLRDKDAAYREQKWGELLKGMLPIPQVHFIGDLGKHRFGITEFIPGITLRDHLLSQDPSNMEELMIEAGEILAKIQSIRFPVSGFLGKDLTIQEPITNTSYIDYARESLKHNAVIDTLGHDMVSKISAIFEKYASLFPGEKQNHLAHGDFDPPNLLVDRLDGHWKITGVLDWEFAFSGSPLQDVANMLRYAHHMPPLYETAFLAGLRKGGFTLPDDWRLRIDLLNLHALLDPSDRLDRSKYPNRCADICELIEHILARKN